MITLFNIKVMRKKEYNNLNNVNDRLNIIQNDLAVVKTDIKWLKKGVK